MHSLSVKCVEREKAKGRKGEREKGRSREEGEL